MKLFSLLFVSIAAFAQNWSGILAPQRAYDWSSAGVTGGIPTVTTQCGSTIAAYTGTPATINTAISNCTGTAASPKFVQLGAGDFVLNGSITLNKSGVVLRGMGADQTRIKFTGASSGCGIGDKAIAVKMCTGTSSWGCSTNCGAGGPDNQATWNSPYTQGLTTINIGSYANLTVGGLIYVDQLNDLSDSGDLLFCTQGDSTYCNGNGEGSTYVRGGGTEATNRTQTEVHKVVSCGTSTPGAACTSSTVTLQEPIAWPNWTSGKTPQAWWPNSGALLKSSGLEDLSIDFTIDSTGWFVGVGFVNSVDSWVKGVRFVNYVGSGFTTNVPSVYHVFPLQSAHLTIRDNYFFGPMSANLTQYQYTPHLAGSLLFENNILDYAVCGACAAGPETGSVYAYNFVTGSHYDAGGFQPHNTGDGLNLWEGNNGGNFFADDIYGPHMMHTLFRNLWDGPTNNPGQSASGDPFDLVHGARFINTVGNVASHTSFTTYQRTDNSNNRDTIFNLGYAGNCSHCGNLSYDPNVTRTLMRWGNWDSKSAAVRWQAGEVGNTTGNYTALASPSSTLPNSFYLASKPSWWGSVAWPPIGPDVTGGNVSTPNTAGHANKIPSRLCYEAAATDSNYSTVNATRAVKAFNASTCYVAAASPVANCGLMQVVKAGADTTVDGSATTGATSYAWTQTAGTTCTLTNASSAIATVNCPSFGQVTFQLTATSSGGNNACTVSYGIVPVDSSNVVQMTTIDPTNGPNIESIIGKQQMYGTVTPTFFDLSEMRFMDRVITEHSVGGFYDPAWLTTPATGTVTFATRTSLVGTGTSFQSLFCGGSTTFDGIHYILLWYTNPDGYIGRFTAIPTGCTDDTHMTIGQGPFVEQMPTLQSGIQFSAYAFQQAGTASGNSLYGGSPENYYDTVVAAYGLYYRTGLTKYLNYARQEAKMWKLQPRIDKGWACAVSGGGIRTRRHADHTAARQ